MPVTFRGFRIFSGFYDGLAYGFRPEFIAAVAHKFIYIERSLKI